MDQAAREQGKTVSGISTGIASKSADLAQQHQQAAASVLGNMYGQDTSAQLKAMGLVPEDVKAGAEANSAPWQALSGMIGAGAQATNAGVNAYKAFQ